MLKRKKKCEWIYTLHTISLTKVHFAEKIILFQLYSTFRSFFSEMLYYIKHYLRGNTIRDTAGSFWECSTENIIVARKENIMNSVKRLWVRVLFNCISLETLKMHLYTPDSGVQYKIRIINNYSKVCDVKPHIIGVIL